MPSKTPRQKTGRRSKWAAAALIGIGLLVTGGIYAGASAAMAATEPTSASTTLTLEDGKKLFQANCATCHGLNLEGTADGPPLYGVGELAVEFQMSTGRMPLQMQGPQAPQKPAQFTEDQIKAIAAWVQSVSPVRRTRIPGSSTVRVTSPTAPSSSASTARCATTSPQPVAP